MKVNKKIIEHLKNSYAARNNHKLGYINYIKDNFCSHGFEKAIIDKVLKKALTQASYQREVAYVQNSMGLYKADPKIQTQRQRKQNEIKQQFQRDNLFTSIYRWFKKN